MPKVIKQCKQCSNEYKTYSGWNTKFCSLKCRGLNDRKSRINITCKECSEKFLIIKSRLKNGNGIKYCSWDCWTKQGFSYWSGKNRVFSKEHIENLKGHTPWNKGLHKGFNNALIKWRELGGVISGEKHYRWNPDREVVKKNQRNDPAYKIWRKEVCKRDKYECQINNKDCFGKLVAHHILPWRDYLELRYEVKNGITLCHFHHPKTRGGEIKLIQTFTGLVMQKN